jgi:hypothetical protein
LAERVVELRRQLPTFNPQRLLRYPYSFHHKKTKVKPTLISVRGEPAVNPEPLEALLLPLQTGAILLITFKVNGYGKLVRAHPECRSIRLFAMQTLPLNDRNWLLVWAMEMLKGHTATADLLNNVNSVTGVPYSLACSHGMERSRGRIVYREFGQRCPGQLFVPVAAPVDSYCARAPPADWYRGSYPEVHQDLSN